MSGTPAPARHAGRVPALPPPAWARSSVAAWLPISLRKDPVKTLPAGIALLFGFTTLTHYYYAMMTLAVLSGVAGPARPAERAPALVVLAVLLLAHLAARLPCGESPALYGVYSVLILLYTVAHPFCAAGTVAKDDPI
jgi:hypothetical protein